MPKSNEKTIKKAVRTTTAQTAKAPNNGATNKYKKNLTICQFKKILKIFAKEQLNEDLDCNKKFYQERLEREPNPEDLKRIKQDFEYMQQCSKDGFLESIGAIETGKTEQLLKHLLIIQNGKIKTDNLKTALNLIKLLINNTENHEDNIFIFPRWIITRDQINHLQYLLRGHK